MDDEQGQTSGEHEQSETAPTRSRRRIPFTAIVGVLLAAGVGVVAVLALMQAKENKDDLARSERARKQLAGELSTLQADLDSLESRVAGTETDIRNVVMDLGAIDDPTDDMADLGSRIDAIERDVATTSSDLDFLGSAVYDSISAFKDCVNEYMDTVGQSGGGRYTYFYC